MPEVLMLGFTLGSLFSFTTHASAPPKICLRVFTSQPPPAAAWVIAASLLVPQPLFSPLIVRSARSSQSGLWKYRIDYAMPPCQ